MVLESPFPKGFTLAELVTAMGVLAILAMVGIITINPLEQFKKSADSRRKSDLAQIQRALEVYYQDFGSYPSMSQDPNPNRICREPAKSGTCVTQVPWGNDWKPYMDVLPIEQRNNKTYAYWTDSTGQSYALYASLDREGRDPQACNNGNACVNAEVRNVNCGGICNYGVTSSNISP